MDTVGKAMMARNGIATVKRYRENSGVFNEAQPGKTTTKSSSLTCIQHL